MDIYWWNISLNKTVNNYLLEDPFLGVCLHNLQSSTPEEEEQDPELDELESESESEPSDPDSSDSSGGAILISL